MTRPLLHGSTRVWPVLPGESEGLLEMTHDIGASTEVCAKGKGRSF